MDYRSDESSSSSCEAEPWSKCRKASLSLLSLELRPDVEDGGGVGFSLEGPR